VLTLTIESYGETLVSRELLRFSDNLADPTNALSMVADLIRKDVEHNFETEGGNAGGWPPLSERRVEEKARLGLDPRILRATGALMESLVNKFDPRHIEHLSPTSLTFGSTVFYGIFHQSSEPRTVIPFRPPIAFTEGDKREMVKVLQRAMLEVTPKATWGA
jgi:phage gpG-like protein